MSIVEPPRLVPPARVEVDRAHYLELLVRTSDTNPQHWPPGYEAGAALLLRIREIEQDCLRQHGRWDVDLLEEAQDTEYEDSIAALENLIEPLEPGEPRYSHEAVLLQLAADRSTVR